MNLPQDYVDTFAEFASGSRSWDEWPRWFAMYASRLARLVGREQMRALRNEPKEAVSGILDALGVTVTPAERPPLFKVDPIEDDLELAEIVQAAGRKAELRLADSPHRGEMGFCHMLWREQKRILAEKYHITWRTPAEMNPDMNFD